MSYEEMSTDLVELLNQHLGIKSAVLVGHSMGGRAVMYTALTHPKVAERIVIVDISPVNRKFDITGNFTYFQNFLRNLLSNTGLLHTAFFYMTTGTLFTYLRKNDVQTPKTLTKNE